MNRRIVALTNALSAALLLSATGAVSAEDAYIKQENVVARENKGLAYEQAFPLKKGDKVAIIAREDKWIKVRFNNKEGYIFQTSVSDKPQEKNVTASNNAQASASSDSAAGRGGFESRQYAQNSNLDPETVEKLIKMSKVDPKKFEAFMNEPDVKASK